ncbi:MAG TPA: PspC domain-containing protein [Thermoleophilaceae bacterium]|nr:PspC domain-containing protein [Thermoleophilaceae bacterium]
MSELVRDRSSAWLGGVCAGVARRYGVDVSLVRFAFVVFAAAGGLGFAVYALAWLFMPAGAGAPARRRIPTGRAAVEVALGTGLLLLSVLLSFRALGLWFSDALVWPLVLVASGGALIWRQSLDRPEPDLPSAEPSSPEAAGSPPPGARLTAGDRRRAAAAAAVSRTGVGIALVLAAGFVFLETTGALGAARDVLLALIAAVVVLGVIFAPWILRLVRSLTAERAQRIRSQERAELAAHLHDSVLQTLAMVQRRAEDPTEVAALARRQERELRAWLSGRPQPGMAAGLAPALEAAATEVEERHGTPVELVLVGDVELDAATEAVVAAAREAMTNAAKFGAGSPIDVYSEVANGRVQVFVRDRGPGFDTGSIPPDRRGVRESIVGRMERHGGRARITSSPDAGTEVELLLEREPAG